MKTIFLKSNINNIWLYNKRISEKKSYKNNKLNALTRLLILYNTLTII